MTDKLKNSFPHADSQRQRTAFLALMDRGPGYFEEIRISAAIASIPEGERPARLRLLTREDIVFRLAEIVNLAREAVQARKDIFRSPGLTREERQQAMDMVSQLVAVAEKQGIAISEITGAELPYSDLAGRPTARELFQPKPQ